MNSHNFIDVVKGQDSKDSTTVPCPGGDIELNEEESVTKLVIGIPDVIKRLNYSIIDYFFYFLLGDYDSFFELGIPWTRIVQRNIRYLELGSWNFR